MRNKFQYIPRASLLKSPNPVLTADKDRALKKVVKSEEKFSSAKVTDSFLSSGATLPCSPDMLMETNPEKQEINLRLMSKVLSASMKDIKIEVKDFASQNVLQKEFETNNKVEPIAVLTPGAPGYTPKPNSMPDSMDRTFFNYIMKGLFHYRISYKLVGNTGNTNEVVTNVYSHGPKDVKDQLFERDCGVDIKGVSVKNTGVYTKAPARQNEHLIEEWFESYIFRDLENVRTYEEKMKFICTFIMINRQFTEHQQHFIEGSGTRENMKVIIPCQYIPFSPGLHMKKEEEKCAFSIVDDLKED